jgi:hypothetical protein
MPTTSLPISRLINVSVNLSPAPAQMQNISTLLLMGDHPIIDVVERMRTYATIDAVVADFGTSFPEYLAAVLWFEQAPQPVSLQIGRWAQAASVGKLVCAPLTAPQQSMILWNAILAGSFTVTIGAAITAISALNFSAQTNMNGVANIIQTALAVAVAGTTCVWNSVYSRFEISDGGVTGVLSLISFLSPSGVGTDISGTMAGLATSSGAYVANGIAAETSVAAVTLMDNKFGQAWYALQMIGAADSDHLLVAPYIEAATNKHIYGVSTNEAGVILSTSTTDIAYQLSQLKYKRTVVQYSSLNLYAVASLLARILTTNYDGNNTVITLMYKQEPGIVAETLTASQMDALAAKNCNVFVAYNNNTAIIQTGVACSGDFLDIITGTDWLALDIQTVLYNLLYTSNTKIPQTDAGNHTLVTGMESVLSQAVTNGLLGPGVWGAGGFGALRQYDFMSKGFYVYAPLVANQSAADRAARKSVAFQIAAKLAGAIHTVNVMINVNR